MLRNFFFLIFVAAAILLFGLIQLLLLRVLNRPWWNKTWIRRSAYTLPALGVLFLAAFGVAEYNRISWLSTVAAPLMVVTIVMELGLMFSLPFSGILHLTNWVIDRLMRRHGHTEETVVDVRRRAFLKGTAAAIPVVALAEGLSGVGLAYAPAEVRLEPILFEHLPPKLHGLRILHISDLHLRHYVTLEDLEQVLTDAAPYEPDLILVTGDISDDLAMLPDALRLLEQARAPLGRFAIPGNHEYFRGIKKVRSIFDRSSIPLLIDRHVRIETAGHALCLGGIDDPMTMRSIPTDFFSTAIKKTFLGADEYDFSILMSHRPDAFPYASTRRIDLTLAGHTHGGQIGFGGRSLLEASFPDSFLWGNYRKGTSHLYTSCGTGHWFPFRLGCPAEAPVIELVSA